MRARPFLDADEYRKRFGQSDQNRRESSAKSAGRASILPGQN